MNLLIKNIDSELLRRLKHEALETGVTLKTLVTSKLERSDTVPQLAADPYGPRQDVVWTAKPLVEEVRTVKPAAERKYDAADDPSEDGDGMPF